MAQIDTLTNVGAVVSTDLALILRGGANVLGTFGSLVGQNATSVTITGGTVNGTVIGGVTPAAGSFTTLGTTGAATFSAGITATTGAFSGGVNITDSSYGIYSTAVAATIGYIGNSANDLTIFSSTAGHNGLRFHDNGILPIDNTGALVDADADLGIGTYRFKDLYLSGTVNAGAATFSGVVKVNTALALGDINLTQTADAKGIVIVDSTESGALKLQHNAASSYIANNDTRNMVFATNSLDRVTIDGSTGAATFSGNVTIGSQTFISTTGGVYVDGGYTTRVTASGSGAAGHDMLFYTGTGAGSERLRIDASGNLLVGKAASSFTTAGVELAQGGTAGKVQIQRSSSPLALVNLTDDGSILNFYKGTTSVGSIGTLGGNLFIGSPNGTAAHLRLGEGGIFPSDSGGYNRNAAIDLGGISSKFKDLYLSGTVNAGAATFSAGVVINESGVDSDFRVESDNDSSALFVDGADGTTTVRKLNLGVGGGLRGEGAISVGTSATDITSENDFGSLCIVSGNSNGNIFTDLVFFATTVGAIVIAGGTVSGGPAGRTYSVVSSKLKLAMASGTSLVKATAFMGTL